jgi:hypothetical protein
VRGRCCYRRLFVCHLQQSATLTRYNDRRRERRALAAIAGLLLVLMIAIVLTVCILLSSAFGAKETQKWLLNFLESVAMQVRSSGWIVGACPAMPYW